jgi:hypothetical protein
MMNVKKILGPREPKEYRIQIFDGPRAPFQNKEEVI